MRTHRLVLCAVCPTLKLTLTDIETNNDSSTAAILLPDATTTEVRCLLSLLYNGCANLYKE